MNNFLMTDKDSVCFNKHKGCYAIYISISLADDFLHYMKFAGKLSHSTRSGSLYNIYYTKKPVVYCCLPLFDP